MNYVMEGLQKKQFFRSLERPLDAPSEEITRLFGTNFDTCVINQDMLEEMPGEMFFFKSKDEGDVRKLRECVAPKTLVLKEGAKVILIKKTLQMAFTMV